MSDLAATNCGGGCSCNEGGCGSILWIIIIAVLLRWQRLRILWQFRHMAAEMTAALWIILLLFCCGGCGNGNGNGFGCC